MPFRGNPPGKGSREMCLLLFSHVLCSIGSILYIVCLPLVSFVTVSFCLFWPLSLCQSLSISFYIFFPLFFFFFGFFFSPPLSLSLSLSLSRQWAVCSLLHVDTLAPPCSSHNWPPGFIPVHCSHTHTHTHTHTEKHKRENTRHRERDRKGRAKSETGRKEGEW